MFGFDGGWWWFVGFGWFGDDGCGVVLLFVFDRFYVLSQYCVGGFVFCDRVLRDEVGLGCGVVVSGREFDGDTVFFCAAVFVDSGWFLLLLFFLLLDEFF